MLNSEQQKVVDFSARNWVEFYKWDYIVTHSPKDYPKFIEAEECIFEEWEELFSTSFGYPLAEAWYTMQNLHPEATASNTANIQMEYYSKLAQYSYDKAREIGSQNPEEDPNYLYYSEMASQANAEYNRHNEKSRQFVNNIPIDEVDLVELDESYNNYYDQVEGILTDFFKDDSPTSLRIKQPDSCLYSHFPWMKSLG